MSEDAAGPRGVPSRGQRERGGRLHGLGRPDPLEGVHRKRGGVAARIVEGGEQLLLGGGRVGAQAGEVHGGVGADAVAR